MQLGIIFRFYLYRLKFKVGPQEIRDFRMIERHYFKDTLLKSYDFQFVFCIPNSENEWASYYKVPPLDKDLRIFIIYINIIVDDICLHPNETQSDSFYFVGDELIMHTKAIYTYFRPNEGIRQTLPRVEVKESERVTVSESKLDARHPRK